jgi:hypothetical protein
MISRSVEQIEWTRVQARSIAIFEKRQIGQIPSEFSEFKLYLPSDHTTD